MFGNDPLANNNPSNPQQPIHGNPRASGLQGFPRCPSTLDGEICAACGVIICYMLPIVVKIYIYMYTSNKYIYIHLIFSYNYILYIYITLYYFIVAYIEL